MYILSTQLFWSTWIVWMVWRWSSNLCVMFLSSWIELCLVEGVYIGCPSQKNSLGPHSWLCTHQTYLVAHWTCPVLSYRLPLEKMSTLSELTEHVRWSIGHAHHLAVGIFLLSTIVHYVFDARFGVAPNRSGAFAKLMHFDMLSKCHIRCVIHCSTGHVRCLLSICHIL